MRDPYAPTEPNTAVRCDECRARFDAEAFGACPDCYPPAGDCAEDSWEICGEDLACSTGGVCSS